LAHEAQHVLGWYEDRELVFAVVHAMEMLTALKTNYYAAWHGEKQTNAT
jgi:hypothetical protein